MPADLTARIARCALRAGLTVEPGVLSALGAYLELLARWNRRINLTALALDPPTDTAIERLLIEPLVAAGRVHRRDRMAIDVGSGGGSPAIPLKIAVPHLRMVLVESKVRKAAFLREVVRQLALDDVEVENRRVEDLLARTDLRQSADVVTLRAVSATERLWVDIRGLLRPSGRVFWFGGRMSAATPEASEFLRAASTETLATPPDSQILILQVDTE